jgi:hypothetical protein
VLRKRGTYTALIAFLAFNLLFNQVALNLFHNKHDAHQSYRLDGNDAQLLRHGEHCKVCALDTLFHLYFEASPEFSFHQPQESSVAFLILAKATASHVFVKGRAPPFQI